MDTEELAAAIDHAIGAQLRAERAKKDYSRERLQELSGVSMKSIQRFEEAQRSPAMQQLAKLCAALEITVVEFVALALKDVDARDP